MLLGEFSNSKHSTKAGPSSKLPSRVSFTASQKNWCLYLTKFGSVGLSGSEEQVGAAGSPMAGVAAGEADVITTFNKGTL